jgi:MoaA/NifB/PqqE/SkfB family radical SAM enzyme
MLLEIGKKLRQIKVIDDAVHRMPWLLTAYRKMIRPDLGYHEWLDKGVYHVRYPSTLIIATTTHCNLNCYICGHSEGYKGDSLTWENYRKLDTAIHHAKTVILTGWGESLMWKHLPVAVQRIDGPKIHIVTNGTLLSREWANRLKGRIQSMQISLNASSPEIYNRDMVGGKWENTVWRIGEFVNALPPEDRKRLTLSYVAHARNLQDIPAFPGIAKNLGIPTVIIQQFLVHTTDRINETLLSCKDEYNRAVQCAKINGGKLGINVVAHQFGEHNPVIQPCTAPFDQVAIAINGDISPCCQGGRLVLGNAYTGSLEEVWFGGEYYRARTGKMFDICKNCSAHNSFDSVQAHTTAYYKEAL